MAGLTKETWMSAAQGFLPSIGSSSLGGTAFRAATTIKETK